MKKENNNLCLHHFEYVKNEKVYVECEGRSIPAEVDVVICTKCGLVKRK